MPACIFFSDLLLHRSHHAREAFVAEPVRCAAISVLEQAPAPGADDACGRFATICAHRSYTPATPMVRGNSMVDTPLWIPNENEAHMLEDAR